MNLENIFTNKIGDIGAKYLALGLSKLIKLTNLFLELYNKYYFDN